VLELYQYEKTYVNIKHYKINKILYNVVVVIAADCCVGVKDLHMNLNGFYFVHRPSLYQSGKSGRFYGLGSGRSLITFRLFRAEFGPKMQILQINIA